MGGILRMPLFLELLMLMLMLISLSAPVSSNAHKSSDNNDDTDAAPSLRITVARSGLRDVPSATHSYGTIEIVNTVSA